MTVLSIERFVRPARRSTVSPRTRAALSARTTMLGRSLQSAREFDGADSPAEQLRVLERFAASATR